MEQTKEYDKMLISCPKCHSIYEIPDDLIPKTGQNFRCQACSNVWHAMRQDAVGYTEEKREEPYIEAIPVSEPPHRNYPANKQSFQIPADTKKRKTPSSKEIIEKEGDEAYTPQAPRVKKKKEITLTSDTGTAFTISTDLLEDIQEDPTPLMATPSLGTSSSRNSLTPPHQERYTTEKPFKGYTKTYLFLSLLVLVALIGFLRREITTLWPTVEQYYNQIGLSGLNNPEYLTFKNIDVTEITNEGKPMLQINADIYNDSFYTTRLPQISLSDTEETFSAKQQILKGYERTSVNIIIPIKNPNVATRVVLGFSKLK